MNEILKEIDKLQEAINAYRPLPANTLNQLKVKDLERQSHPVEYSALVHKEILTCAKVMELSLSSVATFPLFLRISVAFIHPY